MTEDYDQTKARLFKRWIKRRDEESARQAKIMLFYIFGLMALALLLCWILGGEAGQ